MQENVCSHMVTVCLHEKLTKRVSHRYITNSRLKGKIYISWEEYRKKNLKIWDKTRTKNDVSYKGWYDKESMLFLKERRTWE